MMMRVLIVPLLFLFSALLSYPPLASAQSNSRSGGAVETFAGVGAVNLWDDEGNLGMGAPIGGGVGFRSVRGWGIEGMLEGQRTTRRFSSDVRFDSAIVAGRARLLKYFGGGRAQPYAGAGLGAMRVTSTFDWPADCVLGPNHRFECLGREIGRRTSRSSMISVFGGVRITADRHLFVRPEFEVSMAREHLRIGGMVTVGRSW